RPFRARRAGDGRAAHLSAAGVLKPRRLMILNMDFTAAFCGAPQRPGGSMFESIEEAIERFAGQKYIASRRIATVVYLAAALKKPILVEGPAGVGKTDLAKVLALALGHELIRCQGYEGLDEGKALYEWEYAKQLLYTQILKDKISEVLTGAQGLAAAVDRIAKEDEVFFSER